MSEKGARRRRTLLLHKKVCSFGKFKETGGLAFPHVTRSRPQYLSAVLDTFLRFRATVVLQEHLDCLVDHFLGRDRDAFATHHPGPER